MKKFDDLRTDVENKLEEIIQQNDSIWEASYSTARNANVELEKEAMFDLLTQFRESMDQMEDLFLDITDDY